MENVIDYATLFAPLMDELYKQEAKTSILEGDETTVKKGAHGEIKVAKIDMDALGDYDRKSGYTKGGTKFAWETVKYDKERSQELTIDRLDNDEALEMPASKLLSEFIRTKVIPETDAARIAKICGTTGITVKEEKLADAAAVVKALRAASDKMDNDEVPEESRILFIVGSYLSMIEDMDTTKSKKILDKFSTIIKMPQSRMYTQITLADGKVIMVIRKHQQLVKTSTLLWLKNQLQYQQWNNGSSIFHLMKTRMAILISGIIETITYMHMFMKTN